MYLILDRKKLNFLIFEIQNKRFSQPAYRFYLKNNIPLSTQNGYLWQASDRDLQPQEATGPVQNVHHEDLSSL
jgi:hypothetical protein